MEWGLFVDELLGAGNPNFKILVNRTLEIFEMEADQTLPTEFTGFYLGKNSSNGLIILQNVYVKKLKEA